MDKIIVNVAQLKNVRLEALPSTMTDNDIEQQAERLYQFMRLCVPMIVVKKAVIKWLEKNA